ncbi:TetM/TetW/TetO/TetS family tetracycline resistance ribosomal protection protein [Nocardiopsis sp. RSe5-2]|uniref:TetM/TetW/TetO/TetS family tetracycline resistance ribosomal protection protein n=1 Tax=Nocardiopsis endophytica TaxID=3018445 RepID=A0ABT4UA77_9ACTN|nr:TetM/TetW/TetO/TetS family tetracycline resistance ribosomal protection protein [Nocardiopsis endophytica]MDA2813833.1 TetM/TetW/TetO/TetS family tetracycline resistance ribosomal protection protein [Nocardiopsis endophytica]
MTTPPLTIGIVAHVDAGKTSLTERLLFDGGAIDRMGGVDTGDTVTDTGRIERERGITVRAAVTCFSAHGRQVTIVDTPGHADFVAEVERALAVLDAAVLVVSAVEGVQAHTRLLMRHLREAGLPVLVFVNKADRRGARPDGVLDELRRRSDARLLPLNTVDGAGTRQARTRAAEEDGAGFRTRLAEALAEHDDELLTALVEDRPLPPGPDLHARLRAQVAAGRVQPVLFGSAITGAGVAELTRALAGLLPSAPGAGDEGGGEPAGTVFAVDRSPTGDKCGYLRLFSGRLEPRAQVSFARAEPGEEGHSGRITALEVVAAGPDRPRALTAGGIARVRGLPRLRVGDRLGPPRPGAPAPRFPRPSLESVVRAADRSQAGRLHAALSALAEQDPLIRIRVLPGGAVSVLLYGEVQKEVIASTLAEEFGVDAVFEESATVFTERLVGTGEAVEEMGPGVDEFWATVGLRVEPGAPGTGVRFRREVEYGAIPAAYDRAIEETVRSTLGQGLYGWPVPDCVVTLIRNGFFAPASVAADFRGLTPLVLMRALARAGTRVYEPLQVFEVEGPTDALGDVMTVLSTARAYIGEADTGGSTWRLAGEIPSREVHTVAARLPGLTGGEGTWWTRPGVDRAVDGPPPRRERTDGNPLDRAEYLAHLSRTGHA